MRRRFRFQPGGGENGIRADVTLGDQPAAAAGAMIPAFALDFRQVGSAAHDLTAVAEFGAVARSAVGTGQKEGHGDFPRWMPSRWRDWEIDTRCEASFQLLGRRWAR